MLSRRRFMQTNVASLAWPLAASKGKAAGSESHSALPNLTRSDSSPSGTATERGYWNDWPLYLTSKVNEARSRRKAALAALHNEAQARERAQFIRAKVWELIGGPLDKTPLNPRIAGTIDRKKYRIEKLIFESQPQVYVTAHVYVPAVGNPPFPGILAPLGHTSNGKAYRNYQYLYQTLARKGYVVLAFDPFGQGERHQYLDPHTGKSRYGPTGEHSQAGRPLLLLGSSFAQYRVWDAVRALDYLLIRPEIDPQRIGCTGHSGGGTITMYLCALEPRIQTAVEVEGNSENLAGPDYDPPGAVADAEQNLVESLAWGIDRGDLLLAFAPKPLLLCYTPHDAGTTYSPVYSKATHEIFEELQQVYGLMGAQDKVEIFSSPLPHDLDFFNRQATYAWFNRWLGKKDMGSDEDEFETSPSEELNCTPTGQVLTSLGGRSLVQINTDRIRALVALSPLENASANRQAASGLVRTELRRLLVLPTDRTPLEPRILSSHTRNGVAIEEFEFRSEPQIRVPGWLVKPNNGRVPLPTIHFVSERGINNVVAESAEMDALVRRGFALCAINLRGFGITAPRYPTAGPLFYRGEHVEDGFAWASLILGKPVLGQRVWDFLRSLDYLESRGDLDPTRIHVLGAAGGGVATLLGTALDDRPRSVLLEHMTADLRSLVESEEYSFPLASFVFSFLSKFDLPDLVASLAPRACWLLNAEGVGGETLPVSKLLQRYQTTIDSYSASGTEGRLRILVRPDQKRLDTIQAWLENS